MIDYALFRHYEFNWTISYKLSSEVSIGSYGLFVKREFTLSNADYNRWIRKQFNSRLNGALWFVSNCKPEQRLIYYYELRQEENTTIEGYGRCVDFYPMHFCIPGSQCEYDYMAKYKFYLSFESTTCRDYITEKFYKSFYHGLIPIVYGPEQNDYNKLAPPQSFIHIDEFNRDMNKLANYLLAVHSNFELYSMYHQWRKKYEVIIDGKALERIRMCELCERLSKVRQDDVTYYEDVETFFSEKCD
jgi:glycoprotein 3-alpha-L-fucosyltransferase